MSHLSWRIIQVFGKQGVIFIILLLCAKFLSPYEFGVYNFLLASVFFLIMLSDFGISSSTSKYVAECDIIDKGKIKHVIFNSGLIVIIISFIISILTIIFGKIYFKDNYTYILLLLPLTILVPLTSLYDGIYRGLKRFRVLSKISLMAGATSIVFSVILIMNYGLIGALISQNIFYFILTISLAVNIKEFHIKLDKKIMKPIFTYSVLIGLANLGYFMYTKIDLIMLGHYGYILETGYFGLITTLFTLCLMPFSILGTVLAPDNISLKLNNKYPELKKRVDFFMFLSFFLGLIGVALLYFIFPVMMQFFPQYNNQTFFNIFRLSLLVIPIAVVEAVLANGFITPLGNVSLLTKYIVVGGFLNIIFNVLFISYFGYIGVILGTVLVHNTINIVKIVAFRKIFSTACKSLEN